MPFKKGEILFVISKDEEQWWTAKNMNGQSGQIPVPYVQKVRRCSTKQEPRLFKSLFALLCLVIMAVSIVASSLVCVDFYSIDNTHRMII